MVVRVFWGYHHLRKHPYAILPYMGDMGISNQQVLPGLSETLPTTVKHGGRHL